LRTITKYQANDGSEYNNAAAAYARDLLLVETETVMSQLGEIPEDVKSGKGWLQHKINNVNRCRKAILKLCIFYLPDYSDIFHGNPGRNSYVGRILDDNGGPLCDAWNRLCCIDDHAREHQQQYFANNGPEPDHMCIESR